MKLKKSDSGIYALGPLIHNKQAVAKYEEKGLKTVNEIDTIPNHENMIIRSHGVPENIYKEAKNKIKNCGHYMSICKENTYSSK